MKMVRTSFGHVREDWQLSPLPEVVFFQEGPGLRKWQWTDKGMKVINVTNILGNGSVDVNNTSRYISEAEFNKKYSHFAVESGDVMVASSGNTYGKVGRVDSSHLPLMMNTSVIRFHPLNDGVRADYLYCYLRSDLFRNQIEALVTGSAQPNFGPYHLKRMQVVVPPLPTQRKIAAVLSAYDDLIENNVRRIAILEEMAAALYREWFIELRFPGHASVPIAESEQGRVPQGWEKKPIGDVVDLLGGGTPSTKTPAFWEDGTVNWFSPTDLTASPGMFIGESKTKITELGLKKSSARLFPAFSVMLTSRATIGVVSINTRQSCTNQGFITCLPNAQVSAFQLYFWMHENKEQIIAYATGAVFKEISKTNFRKIPIVIAAQPVRDEFERLMRPIGEQIHTLQLRNANLRATRDLLLPKLVAGEVDVSQLAIAGATDETDETTNGAEDAEL